MSIGAFTVKSLVSSIVGDPRGCRCRRDCPRHATSVTSSGRIPHHDAGPGVALDRQEVPDGRRRAGPGCPAARRRWRRRSPPGAAATARHASASTKGWSARPTTTACSSRSARPVDGERRARSPALRPTGVVDGGDAVGDRQLDRAGDHDDSSKPARSSCSSDHSTTGRPRSVAVQLVALPGSGEAAPTAGREQNATDGRRNGHRSECGAAGADLAASLAVTHVTCRGDGMWRSGCARPSPVRNTAVGAGGRAQCQGSAARRASGRGGTPGQEVLRSHAPTPSRRSRCAALAAACGATLVPIAGAPHGRVAGRRHGRGGRRPPGG